MCGAIEKLRKMGWKTSKQIFLSLKCYVTSIEISFLVPSHNMYNVHIGNRISSLWTFHSTFLTCFYMHVSLLNIAVI